MGTVPQETMTPVDPIVTQRRRTIFLIIIAVAIVDQLAKFWVVANLDPQQPYPIIGDWARLLLVRNPGAAFSFGSSATWFFTLIQLAAVTMIMMFGPRFHKLSLVGIALVGGGAMGNLIDRMFRPPAAGIGHVVDFISIGNFAIFNLADSAITIGVVLFIIATLRTPAEEGSTPS